MTKEQVIEKAAYEAGEKDGSRKPFDTLMMRMMQLLIRDGYNIAQLSVENGVKLVKGRESIDIISTDNRTVEIKERV